MKQSKHFNHINQLECTAYKNNQQHKYVIWNAWMLLDCAE